MNIVTPKNAIEIVLAQKTKTTNFRPYETTLEKWLFWLAVGTLIGGGVLGSVVYFWKQPIAAGIALLILLASSLLAAAYQVAIAVPEFLKLRNIEREVSNPLVSDFNKDIDLISELARDYQNHHLAYARDGFSLMATQLRSRISLLVGAIDKVGVIPLGVTAYFSVMKALKDGQVEFSGLEWGLVAIIFLYLFALRMNAAAQWMDRVSILYKEAFDSKQP